MLHSRYCYPRVMSWNGTRSPEQISRLQDISVDLALSKTKQYEIGRPTILGYKKGKPATTYNVKQFEFGDMDFYLSLANMETPGTGDSHIVDLDDLKLAQFDIAAYLTDENGTFTGTLVIPGLRLNTFSINVASPDDIIQRSFSLIGEQFQILDGNFYTMSTDTVGAVSGDVDGEVTCSPDPIAFALNKYILRVLRVRGLTVTELDEGTGVEDDTWTYNDGTKKVTVKTCEGGDVIKVFFEAATAGTLWTDDDLPSKFLEADSCDILMKVGNSTTIHNLQSIGIDINFTRADYGEIGTKKVTQTGAKDKVVKVSLNKFAQDFSLENLLAGDTLYPYIDTDSFVDNIQLMIKVYADNTKQDFLIGYLISNLTTTTLNVAQPVEEYQKRTQNLESDNLIISDDIGDILFS